MAYLERLRAEVPPSLVELLEIPGLGPKTVRQLHEELGIATLDELRQAAEAGRLRDAQGPLERTEQLILEGIDRLSRAQPPGGCYLHQAEEHIAALIDGPRRRRRASARSSRPARSAGGRRRSATSTSSRRRPTRRR